MTKEQELVISRVAEQLNENRVRTAQRSVIKTEADRQNARNRRAYLRGRAASVAAKGRAA